MYVCMSHGKIVGLYMSVYVCMYVCMPHGKLVSCSPMKTTAKFVLFVLESSGVVVSNGNHGGVLVMGNYFVWLVDDVHTHSKMGIADIVRWALLTQ